MVEAAEKEWGDDSEEPAADASAPSPAPPPPYLTLNGTACRVVRTVGALRLLQAQVRDARRAAAEAAKAEGDAADVPERAVRRRPTPKSVPAAPKVVLPAPFVVVWTAEEDCRLVTAVCAAVGGTPVELASVSATCVCACVCFCL